MAAFNDIVVQATCPACREVCAIRCQTHVASSFDGDERGRFCHRTYELGQRMRWWDASDARFPKWREGGRIEPILDEDRDEEACYSTCTSCNAELCVVIAFHRLVPELVVLVAKEADWPVGYYG